MSVCRVDRDYPSGNDRASCYQKCERDYPCGKDRDSSGSNKGVSMMGTKVSGYYLRRVHRVMRKALLWT